MKGAFVQSNLRTVTAKGRWPVRLLLTVVDNSNSNNVSQINKYFTSFNEMA